MITDKFRNPTQSFRCILRGPSESVFLTNLMLNSINEYDKIIINSHILHQDLYQKLFICFSNCLPIHIIPQFSMKKILI